MRVIFLDIDGVLNSTAFLRKLDAAHRDLGHHEKAQRCVCYRLENQVDPEAIIRLNHLVAEIGAKIVISSSWRRLLDPPELRRVLGGHGLVAEIIGETPNSYDDEVRAVYQEAYLDRLFRGHEIDYWLRQHPEVDRFVILDDDGDMAMHVNRLVQTDGQVGLTDEDVEMAIRVMSWDGKTPPSASGEVP